MRQQTEFGSFHLTERDINTFLEGARAYLSLQKLEAVEINRLCLTAEEVLLNWHGAVGEACRCDFQMKRRFGRIVVALSIPGAPINPLADNEENVAILRRLGLSPSYEYVNGENHISISPRPQKRNPLINLLVAIGAAALMRIILLFFPPDTSEMIINSVAQPLTSVFVRALNMIAIPFLMLTFMQGVIEIGDLNTFAHIGKRLICMFFTAILILSVSTAAVAFFVFPTTATGGAAEGDILKILSDLFLGIVPANFIEPFTSGNMLQVLLIAIFLGLAILSQKDKVPFVAALIGQGQILMQWMLSVLTKLVPLYIAFSVLSFLFAAKLSDMQSMLSAALLTASMCMAFVIILVFLVSAQTKRSLSQTVRFLSPGWLTAFATSSSTASFPINLKSCDEDWGVDPRLSRFGLTLGVVLFKPAGVIESVVLGFLAATIVGVPITLSFILVLLLSSIILSTTSLGVPGGALVRYTAMMTILGMNIEAVGIVITLNLLLNPLLTATNVSSLQMMMVMFATQKEKNRGWR